MPKRMRDLKPRFSINERNSGVPIEKSVFSMVARCSGPSGARLRRSSVFPRAAVQYQKEDEADG